MLKNRIISVIILICIVVSGLYIYQYQEKSSLEEGGLSLFGKNDTLYFWYADETMTDYINSAAVAFGEKYNKRVIPSLMGDSQYLEAINDATIRTGQVPDAFLISNDLLEKAYLAGLVCEVEEENSILNQNKFSEAALNAVTYKNKMIGYPLFFETSVLLYNDTYLKEWANQQVTREEEVIDESLFVDTEIGAVEIETEEISTTLDDYLAKRVPTNLDELLEIANTFDPPENVEVIFKWDVSDIFYNYYFVGNYLQLGGETGDNKSIIDINNENTIQCLKVYRALNQFFSIESDTVTYTDVIDEFIHGEIVFTIATTDAIQKLEEAKAEERFDYEYGVAIMPDPSEVLKGRSLSVTSIVVVNGYSENKELANQFATFLVDEYADNLYERTGRVSTNKDINKEDEKLTVFKEEYAESISFPKIIETSNFWIQLEILFSKVWNGESVDVLLEELENQILSQINEG